MKRTLLARQAPLAVWAAIAIGLAACGGGGGGQPAAPPTSNPAPASPPPPGPGADPAPPAPEAVRLPMRTMDPGAVVTLAGGGRLDSAAGPLSCRWRQTAGTLRVALRGADSCAPQFDAPDRPEDAVLTFTLTATDGAGAVRAVVVETITVRGRPPPPGAPPPPRNAPPTADAGGDIAVNEGAVAALDGSGADPEDGALTFSWTQTGGAPQVALAGADTARATFTAPELEANAVLTFRLTVTDPDGAFASDAAAVTVRADNDAPTADAGADLAIDDGEAVTLDGSASSDPEGKALTYAWAQTGGTPTAALIGANTAAPTFTAPQVAANAVLTFTLTATDPGGASATDSVTVTVRADDDAPIADAGDDVTTYEGDSVTLDGSGSSDPEGGTLTYAWTQTGTPAATLSSASAAAPTFTAPAVTADTPLTFTLTVSDAGGQSATDRVTVTVRNVRPANAAVRTPGSGETLEPAAAKSTASSWKTAEYTRSRQLPFINAAEGYAARTMGQPGGGGRTIAIYDGAINSAHPDLTGVTQINLDSIRSTSIHGTRVIGVAAARRNGVGMHGVAYNANIVDITRQGDSHALEAAFASAAGLDARTFSYPGWRYSYTSDPAGSAHIIIPSPLDHTELGRRMYLSGMRTMAGRGRIIVAATGNTTSSEPYGYPAKGFADEGIAGFAIGVTALNAAGTGWDGRNNACGSIKQYCLMAPKFVYTTDHPTTSQPETDRYTDASGTSYAAPVVAGAAAVVWAAFPNKTARQVVDRLLTTARQIDDATCAYDSTTGISAKCGHGLLDLGEAMNPVGFTSIALPGSGMAPVRGTAVRLPPGARVRAAPALADTVVYDEQGFPFLHDLNAAFLAGEADDSGTLMHGFLEPARREWTVAPLGVGAAFSFAGPADYGAGAARRAWRAFDPDPGAAGEALRDYRFSLQPQAGLTVTVGQGAGAPGARTGFAASPGGGLFTDGLSVRPFAAFSGEGPGVGVDWRLDGRTRLSFSGRDGRSRFGAPRARLVAVGVDRRFAGGLSVKLGAGTLRERGARLGMRSSGGFGPAPASVTNFVDVGVEKPLSGKAAAFGSYSFGSTGARAGAPGSLVRQWGALRSDSLAFGVSASGLFAPGDRLTGTVSAPFRPRGRVAMVLAPAREVSDGEVAFAARAVSLASAGREVRTQLVYDAWSGDGAAAAIGGYARFGADSGAPEGGPDWGAAAKLRLEF